MFGLAEEIGLVGGDGVDEIGQFGFEPALPEKMGAIGRKAGHTQNPHSAAQSPFHHQAFGGRELDADLTADQRRDALKIGFAEAVVFIDIVGNAG